MAHGYSSLPCEGESTKANGPPNAFGIAGADCYVSAIMSGRFRFVLLMILSGAHVIAVCAQGSLPHNAEPQARSSKVLWLDFDMNTIPEPKQRASGYYDVFFKGQFIERARENLDPLRWARRAAGHRKQASNVNALDEVPDSSWYTNRHHIRRMSAAELRRGPNTGNGPDFTSAVVTKAKTSGVTPGLMVKDASGESYLIKFDSINYPNLQSGAEVISTKILYALGYNVPENYIAYIHSDNLTISDGVEIGDAKTGKSRQLTREDINQMLWRVARTSDGRCRVLASKVLKGNLKGPFPLVGFRTDDPNDLIPHEHRRELRALRVFDSWINDWDFKETQTMDVYVEKNGRKFLRHYLLDFGSSLGAGKNPTEYYHGREYELDLKSITKEIFSLGVYESANEKKARIISSEIGSFTADDFDPGSWKPVFPSVMFDNMTDEDAFWATRLILSFTEDDLRSIIDTAEYTDTPTNNYMLRTLLERRQMIASYWLGRSDALSNFLIHPVADGVTVDFTDLIVDQKRTWEELTHYTYQVKGQRYESPKRTVKQPVITINRETLGAATERGSTNTPIEVTIWTHRRDFTSDPVRIYLDWNPDFGSPKIRRIVRS
jgi:hypothetical protein